MATQSQQGSKRSAQASATAAGAGGGPSQSRQPSQPKPPASRAQNGGTRAGSKQATKPASKAGSKPASKQASRVGTRASQKKPTAGNGLLATVGEDGQIVVGDKEAGGANDGQEEAYADDGEYYDDEEGEYDEEGEEDAEDVYQEEEVEEFDYSTFQYKPYRQYVRDPDEPRVTIETGPEACSCFPSRSSRNIPSMLYEKVDCEHEGLQGYAHLGVFRFDDNWDARHETTLKPKLADRLMANKGFVWGYPNFIFVEADEKKKRSDVLPDEVEDDDDEGAGEEDDEEGQYDGEYDNDEYDEEEEGLPPAEEEAAEEDEDGGFGGREGYYDEYGDYHYFEDGASLPSRMYDSQGELLSRQQSRQVSKPPSTAPKPSSALEAILPRIGYTPEPTEPASRVATAMRTPEKTLSLPPISPAQSYYADSRERTPVRFKPRTLHRTFQGKYYDPVTKQSYEFEITPDFRRRIDRWHSKKEGLGPVAGRTSGFEPQSGQQSATAASRANSQYSNASRGAERQIVSRWQRSPLHTASLTTPVVEGAHPVSSTCGDRDSTDNYRTSSEVSACIRFAPCVKDTLKASLKSFHVNPDSWETTVQDCPAWQNCISKGVSSYNQNRTAEAHRKRELCKSRANS